jgi:hypothetical protein
MSREDVIFSSCELEQLTWTIKFHSFSCLFKVRKKPRIMIRTVQKLVGQRKQLVFLSPLYIIKIPAPKTDSLTNI